MDELERQLIQNSNNSSKPPSSDSLRKPTNLRVPAGRKGHQWAQQMKELLQESWELVQVCARKQIPVPEDVIGAIKAWYDNILDQGKKELEKVSGIFQTQAGAHIFARLRSVISSLLKQKKNILVSLHHSLCNNSVFE